MNPYEESVTVECLFHFNLGMMMEDMGRLAEFKIVLDKFLADVRRLDYAEVEVNEPITEWKN